MDLIKLNIGCGPYKMNGYVNVDRNPVWKPDAVSDVRKGIPYKDNEVDEIHAHHFIEHLDKDEIIAFLAECYRVLKPNGVLDLLFPIGLTFDLDHKSYLGENSLVLITGGGSSGVKDEYYYGPHIIFTTVTKVVGKDAKHDTLHIVMRKKV